MCRRETIKFSAGLSNARCFDPIIRVFPRHEHEKLSVGIILSCRHNIDGMSQEVVEAVMMKGTSVGQIPGVPRPFELPRMSRHLIEELSMHSRKEFDVV